MDAELRQGVGHILRGAGVHLPHQTIDALIEALKAAKKEKGYIWKVTIWGDLGHHWGAGFTPEEAILNAYRMYCIAWKTDPEDGPVEEPSPPEGIEWAYRPEKDTQWYNVQPPQVDFESLVEGAYESLTAYLLPLRQLMIMFGAVNTELVGNATALETEIEDWHYELYENSSLETRSPTYCMHENAEDASANGPNLLFCHACQTMFRTDIP
jgi:hypothetical protein